MNHAFLTSCDGSVRMTVAISQNRISRIVCWLIAMSIFAPAPKPRTPLGYHRMLSPTAGVKVSPIALGGISIGGSWSDLFGQNEAPFTLLDTYFSLGGNFIGTSNTYNSEDSERLIGEWMEKCGIGIRWLSQQSTRSVIERTIGRRSHCRVIIQGIRRRACISPSGTI